MTDLKSIQTRILTEFTKKQKLVMDEFSERSMQCFLEWTKKYSEEMYNSNLQIVHTHTNDNQEQMQLLEQLFKNYSQLRGKVKHGQKSSYCLARLFYYRKLIRRFFRLWNNQASYMKHIERMKLYTLNYRRKYTLSLIFDKWKNSSRQNVRNEIQRTINKKTDNEIQKMQREYEGLIAQLEGLLEKKLMELKVEEEQHRELLRRYEGIAEKRQLNLQKH